MVKNDLREQGFSVIEKTPKQSRITVLWVISAVCFIIVTILGINLFFQFSIGADGSTLAYLRSNTDNPLSGFFENPANYWYMIIAYLIYLFRVWLCI